MKVQKVRKVWNWNEISSWKYCLIC